MLSNRSFIHEKPDLHFSICSTNKELFRKFDEALRKNGLVGLPDLQGNLHYVVDGRRGFPTAYKHVKGLTMKIMESQLDFQNQRVKKYEEIAEALINKYGFDKALIGTKFINHILVYSLLDKSLLLSFSNNLYPLIAEKFQSSPEKICYSVRYAFKKLEQQEDIERKKQINKDYFYNKNMTSLGNRSTIYKLYQEAESMAGELSQ